MAAAQRAQERRRSALLWGGVVTVVLAMTAAIGIVVVKERANRPTLEAVRTFTVDQGHVTTPVAYAQTPPAGGQHAPVWLNCGQYTQPVPNENAVHSMEHGAVWVTYRDGTPADQVRKLRSALPDTYALLSPYKGLPAPVVASAWGKQLALESADDPRLAEFVKAYRQGPQTPEPGAACTGGIDGTGSSMPEGM
ncbi:hypothetical protein N864_16245 [Intrasporangium chromatireducens Q5-1]|uniref:DUF3105 domain-containing protein n=2 Tax=Intrasporangium TaxID=53357 RepID=W9GDE8_9MICO|nr:hypothetical protein N864_16245 [Intrasporangium chromatireducens Q5-1]